MLGLVGHPRGAPSTGPLKEKGSGAVLGLANWPGGVRAQLAGAASGCGRGVQSSPSHLLALEGALCITRWDKPICVSADTKCHEDLTFQRLRVFSTIPQKPLVRLRVGWSAAAMAQPEPLGWESVVWYKQLWSSLMLVTCVPLHWHKESASYKQVTC